MTTYEGPWQRHFAWIPTKTDRGWKWLRIVYRRKLGVTDYLWRVQHYWWVYRSERPY